MSDPAARWIVLEANENYAKVRDCWGQIEVSLELADVMCTHIWRHDEPIPLEERQGVEDPDADYQHICELEDELRDIRTLIELRNRLRAGTEPVGCPHAYWAKVNGVEFCQVCGEPKP